VVNKVTVNSLCDLVSRSSKHGDICMCVGQARKGL